MPPGWSGGRGLAKARWMMSDLWTFSAGFPSPCTPRAGRPRPQDAHAFPAVSHPPLGWQSQRTILERACHAAAAKRGPPGENRHFSGGSSGVAARSRQRQGAGEEGKFSRGERGCENVCFINVFHNLMTCVVGWIPLNGRGRRHMVVPAREQDTPIRGRVAVPGRRARMDFTLTIIHGQHSRTPVGITGGRLWSRREGPASSGPHAWKAKGRNDSETRLSRGRDGARPSRGKRHFSSGVATRSRQCQGGGEEGSFQGGKEVVKTFIFFMFSIISLHAWWGDSLAWRRVVVGRCQSFGRQ
jgi:hypothetical protein